MTGCKGNGISIVALSSRFLFLYVVLCICSLGVVSDTASSSQPVLSSAVSQDKDISVVLWILPPTAMWAGPLSYKADVLGTEYSANGRGFYGVVWLTLPSPLLICCGCRATCNGTLPIVCRYSRRPQAAVAGTSLESPTVNRPWQSTLLGYVGYSTGTL